MGWPTVLGLISYIVIIGCLTFWFTRSHFRKSRLWEESQTDTKEEPTDPVPGSQKSGRD